MTMRPVDGQRGSYPAGSLFLFPFKRGASSIDGPAYLPGAGASPLIKTVPMATLGLPENGRGGGVWIMNAGTSTAHLMTPGE